MVQMGKKSACKAKDLGLIPITGRSPGKGHGNPFQYSCLENPLDRGAWWASVCGSQRVGHDWTTKNIHHTETGSVLPSYKQWFVFPTSKGLSFLQAMVCVNNYSHYKNMQKGKMVVWGGLTKIWEKKWAERQSRKDTPIWMQSSKEYQGEIRKPSSVIDAKK